MWAPHCQSWGHLKVRKVPSALLDFGMLGATGVTGEEKRDTEHNVLLACLNLGTWGRAVRKELHEAHRVWFCFTHTLLQLADFKYTSIFMEINSKTASRARRLLPDLFGKAPDGLL